MPKLRPAPSSLLLCALLTWSATAADDPTDPEPAPEPPAGVVYVLDGSGRLRLMADDLAQAVRAGDLNLEVVEVNWSHGAGRIFADLRSTANHRAQGRALADRILAQRRDFPKGKICVVTHSAGAAVALAAADHLPEGAVDRIILLAPAVSSHCDLNPALRAAREGVDVFYSETDLVCRSLTVLGCADGWHPTAAGTTGFLGGVDSADKLRQHHYDLGMSRTTHLGGHYGWTKFGVLREYVVPLLAGGD